MQPGYIMLKKLSFLSWMGKNEILYKNLRNGVVMSVKQAKTYNYQNTLEVYAKYNTKPPNCLKAYVKFVKFVNK